MCAKCDMIDYMVADCWRPCYQPPPQPRNFIPTSPRGGFDDEGWAYQHKINALIDKIKRLERENGELRKQLEYIEQQRHQQQSKAKRFEGLEA